MRNRSKVLALVWGVALATTLGTAYAAPRESMSKGATTNVTMRAGARRAVRTEPHHAHKRRVAATIKKATRAGNGETAVRKQKPRAARPHQHGVTVQAGRRVARPVEPPPRPEQPCLHPPVAIERGFGGDVEPIALTLCDGTPAPLAILRLSILARPASASRTELVPEGDHKTETAQGVKLLGGGLVVRLQNVVDHFHAGKVTIVSGYRPNSAGSFHQMAQALDVHFDGIRNEEVVAFCRTLDDTGCGYYPNSSFVHMDVRPARTGHVFWIDASGPGEAPRYVSTWPIAEDRPSLVARPALAVLPAYAEDPFAP